VTLRDRPLPGTEIRRMASATYTTSSAVIPIQSGSRNSLSLTSSVTSSGPCTLLSTFRYTAETRFDLIAIQSIYFWAFTQLDLALPKVTPTVRQRFDWFKRPMIVMLSETRDCVGRYTSASRAAPTAKLAPPTSRGAKSVSGPCSCGEQHE
jgi:hypothetical protein